LTGSELAVFERAGYEIRTGYELCAGNERAVFEHAGSEYACFEYTGSELAVYKLTGYEFFAGYELCALKVFGCETCERNEVVGYELVSLECALSECALSECAFLELFAVEREVFWCELFAVECEVIWCELEFRSLYTGRHVRFGSLESIRLKWSLWWSRYKEVAP